MYDDDNGDDDDDDHDRDAINFQGQCSNKCFGSPRFGN